jgi:hypothetical protein
MSTGIVKGTGQDTGWAREQIDQQTIVFYGTLYFLKALLLLKFTNHKV